MDLDIIWNLSLACPWDCGICCVDAAHVSSHKGDLIIRSNNLQDELVVDRDSKMSLFDQATKLRQEQGLELSLKEKFAVLDNLSDYNISFNFSGGDPLVTKENFEVIKRAFELFGRGNIKVSVTGAGLGFYTPEYIASFISKLKFSYDSPKGYFNPHRPRSYSDLNLLRASKFSNVGVSTMAETPLSINNLDSDTIKLLYSNLNHAGIDELLLMRLFPVGRGSDNLDSIPSREEYLKAIYLFRELEVEYGKPKIKLQCALQSISLDITCNPCDLYRESFAISPSGLLLTSAWALNYNAQPLDEAFVLGNIATESMDKILDSPKARIYQDRLNENFGHCKVFAYLHSLREDAMDRIFDNTDPLLVEV